MSTAPSDVTRMQGVAALPRRNGELAFDEPWQARAFGLAVHTVERLDLDWDVFRQELIRSIDDDPESDYWERWLLALERLVGDRAP